MMRRVIAIIVVSCFAGAAWAQEQAVSKLSFNEAVKIGLERNISLKQQENLLFASQVQKNQSIAAFAPLVYGQGRIGRQEGQQQNPENGNFENLTVDNISGSLNAEMTLFNGFSRINTLNQNINLLRAQSSLVKRGQQEVIFTVANQYLQVLLDQELLRIAIENHNTQKVILDQLRERVNLGARAESELYTQDAQVKNMELLALRASVTLNTDKAKLTQTLQLDPAIPFEVTFPELTDGYSSLEGIALDSLYKVALENREDRKQQSYQTQANKSAYKASASGYLPRVTAVLNYGTVYYSNLSASFRDQFWDQNPNLYYGVSVYIPIYDRQQTRSSRVTSRVLYENAKLEYDNMDKAIKVDVQTTYNNYAAAIQAYHASQAQFRAGELALKTQEESFALGVSDQVTLAQANQTFVTAASSKAQAEVTLVFQKILLDYAVGTLKIEDIK